MEVYDTVWYRSGASLRTQPKISLASEPVPPPTSKMTSGLAEAPALPACWWMKLAMASPQWGLKISLGVSHDVCEPEQFLSLMHHVAGLHTVQRQFDQSCT